MFGMAVLLTALGLALLAVRWAVGAMRRGKDPADESSQAMLGQFERLHTQGALSDAEYQRLKIVFQNKLRVKLGQPPLPVPGLPSDRTEEEEFEWQDVDLKRMENPPASPPAQGES
jgi:hypothetical protein